MKKQVLLITIISVLMLSGCSNMMETVEGEIESKIFEQSEIQKDEKYRDYKKREQDGELDEKGVYYRASKISENGDEVAEEERTGQVHVTFAKNNYLNIRYYKDAEHNEEVKGSCYLNPNDCIYASVPQSNSQNTNLYHFFEYRIYEYSEKGMNLLNWTVNGKDMVLQIPMDYSGEEISVVPIGCYENRQLTLNNYYMDAEGNSHQLAGKWTIDKQETTGDSIAISPVVSYVLSYEYDSESYFFVSSNPACRYQDNEDGIVIFKEADAKSDITNYSIELHPYITTEIESDVEWNYKINDGEKTADKKKSQSISNLKYNDRIVIYTDNKTEFTNYDKSQLTEPIEAEISGGYSYTFNVRAKNASFYFNPSEYSYSHGSIIFKYRGRELTDGLYLGEGSQIEYEAGEVEEGYWLPDGDHTIIVGDEKETQNALNEIKFYPHIQVKLYLAQPKVGGTIIYSMNGSVINTPNIEVYAGTNIYMIFEGWEGWICSAKDNTLYIVSENASQETDVEGIDVDNIFSENEDHKPKLSVVLDQSIGEKLQIGVSASGYNQTGVVYQKSTFKSTYTLDVEKVGTEEGITISLDNDSIQSGYAIKLVLTKTDTNGKKSEETKYVQKLPVSEVFAFYDESEITKSPIYYDNATVTISLVEVNTYDPKSIDNATISLEYADTGATVNTGEILAGDREVIVTITPANGYYVTGTKKVSDDIYQNTMTYKKYLSDIDEIIKDNPVKKIYTITLDDRDSYGNVVYKLNGTVVTGEIEVREKQKLTLEYEITDSDYEIQPEGLLKFAKSKTKETITIDISEEIDGKTIKCEDYISVIKKEGE